MHRDPPTTDPSPNVPAMKAMTRPPKSTGEEDQPLGETMGFRNDDVSFLGTTYIYTHINILLISLDVLNRNQLFN